MPRMHLFNRRINASTDDFPIPSAISICIRVCFGTIGTLWLERSLAIDSCKSGETTIVFWGLLLLLSTLVGLGLDTLILYYSSLGAPVLIEQNNDDVSKREKYVPGLLAVRTAWGVIADAGIAIAILAILSTTPTPSSSSSSCTEVLFSDVRSNSALRSAFLVSCSLLLLHSIFCSYSLAWMALSSVVTSSKDEEEEPSTSLRHPTGTTPSTPTPRRLLSAGDHSLIQSSHRWAKRCRTFSWCCRGVASADASFEIVGSVLAGIFEHVEVAGLSASDVAAALAVVRAEQKDEEKRMMAALQSEETDKKERRVITSSNTATSVGRAMSPSSSSSSPFTINSLLDSGRSILRDSLNYVQRGIVVTRTYDAGAAALGTYPFFETPVQTSLLVAKNNGYDDESEYAVEDTATTTTTTIRDQNLQILREATRCSTFAVAAYGWPLYAYMHPCTITCTLPCEWCLQVWSDTTCRRSQSSQSSHLQSSSSSLLHRDAYPDPITGRVGGRGLTPGDICGCNEAALRTALSHSVQVASPPPPPPPHTSRLKQQQQKIGGSNVIAESPSSSQAAAKNEEADASRSSHNNVTQDHYNRSIAMKPDNASSFPPSHPPLLSSSSTSELPPVLYADITHVKVQGMDNSSSSPSSSSSSSSSATTPSYPFNPLTPPPPPTGLTKDCLGRGRYPRHSLLHASYTNLFFTVPWYLAVDTGFGAFCGKKQKEQKREEEKKGQQRGSTSSSSSMTIAPSSTTPTSALVLCLRGTLSPEDMITDALAIPISLYDDPEGKLFLDAILTQKRQLKQKGRQSSHYYRQDVPATGYSNAASGVGMEVLERNASTTTTTIDDDDASVMEEDSLLETCSWVHAGMWQAATIIRKKLFARGLLRALGEPCTVPGFSSVTGTLLSIENAGEGKGSTSITTTTAPTITTSTSTSTSSPGTMTTATLLGPSSLQGVINSLHQQEQQSTHHHHHHPQPQPQPLHMLHGAAKENSTNTSSEASNNNNIAMTVPLQSHRRERVTSMSSSSLPTAAAAATFATTSTSTSSPTITPPLSPFLEFIICGHSLGAGVASLLALQLQPFYPKLRCYAFCPPGALVAPPVAELMNPFVTSIVLGKDLVPRMSLPALTELGKEMVESLGRVKRHKTSILCSSMFGDSAWPGSRVCIPLCRVPEYSGSVLLVPAKEKLDEVKDVAGRRGISNAAEAAAAEDIEEEAGTTTATTSTLGVEDVTIVEVHPPTTVPPLLQQYPPTVTQQQQQQQHELASLIAARRNLFAKPMCVPGNIIHLLRRTKHAIDWPTWVLKKMFSVCGIWKFGLDIGDVIASLFCGLCRRTKSEYTPRWSQRPVTGEQRKDDDNDDDSGSSTRRRRRNTPPSARRRRTEGQYPIPLARIAISPYMISDHMPDKMERVLHEVLEEMEKNRMS